MDHQLTRLSKRLSFVLRHHPDKIGIKLDRYGRVDLQTLITKFNQHFGTPISEKIIRKIMRESDKQRYASKATLFWHYMGIASPYSR